MKTVLLFASCLFISTISFAQCVPMADFGDEPFGIMPDADQGLVDGEVGVLYTQQIDVKIPADGSFIDFPFISVDSASIVTLTGLPPGLTLECAENADSECTYLGGTEGCAIISGFPTSGGVYELEIEIIVYNTLAPIPFAFDDYSIEISGPVGIEEATAFESLKLQPNPASDMVTLKANTKESGSGDIRIFDLVGKQVHQQSVQLVAGSNSVVYNTSELPEGVYIYRIDAFGQSQSRRLVVIH